MGEKELSQRIESLREQAVRAAVALVDFGRALQSQVLVLDNFKKEMAALFDEIDALSLSRKNEGRPEITSVPICDCARGDLVWVFHGPELTRAEVIDPDLGKILINGRVFFTGAVYKRTHEEHH